MKKMKNLILFIMLSITAIGCFGQGAGTCQKASDPGAYNPGVLECWKWVNTNTGTHWCYNGTSWDICGDTGTDANDIDYVDNVVLSGTSLNWTGIGNAFDGSVDLSSIDTDEQNLSVGAGTSTTSVIEIEDGTPITLVAGTNVTLSENLASDEITINATPGGGSTDYVNSVDYTAATNVLNWTGVGLAFDGSIDLSDLEDTYQVTTFQGNSVGQLRITETDEGGATTDTNVSGVENFPDYDTKAAADAALPAGRFWIASTSNTMGQIPGNLNITYN
jgi:hypothetical protein